MAMYSKANLRPEESRGRSNGNDTLDAAITRHGEVMAQFYAEDDNQFPNAWRQT